MIELFVNLTYDKNSIMEIHIIWEIANITFYHPKANSKLLKAMTSKCNLPNYKQCKLALVIFNILVWISTLENLQMHSENRKFSYILAIENLCSKLWRNTLKFNASLNENNADPSITTYVQALITVFVRNRSYTMLTWLTPLLKNGALQHTGNKSPVNLKL